jgi:hypothetical protein
MAIIAVPAGLAAWALRSGELFQILKENSSAATRQQTYNSLVPESLAWFGLIAVGYLGVFAA